jgi:hypothetical protein
MVSKDNFLKVIEWFSSRLTTSCFPYQCLDNIGHFKFPLMDLKLLPGKAEDNKAQAGQPCSVNVASEETSLKEDAVL